MSVHSTSPIMSMSEVQVIPMEENRRQSWAEGGPKTSGYNIHQQDNDGTYPIIFTMLQKLSKCEVKAARYGHFSNLLN